MTTVPRDDDALRSIAIKHLERVRKLKNDTAAYVLGILVFGTVWAVTQYQDSGGWPHHLSGNGNPGDWDPWILWVVIVWGFLLALDVLRTYFRRPTTEAEIEKEVARLKGH